jgi:hypothetical protein
MITADNGGDITSALSGVATKDDFANVFIPKLSIAKNCGTASAKDTGCFPNARYRYLNGSYASAAWDNYSTCNWFSTILTNDGMSYAFQGSSASCGTNLADPSTDTSNPLHDTCMQIHIDINGPNKGPSMIGRDMFFFWLTKKGLYPRGAYPSTVSSECSTYGDGCASQVLLDGAMDY